MFDFFKELPGQEARIISRARASQSIASTHQLVGTQMHEKELELGCYRVLSSQTRIERLLLDSIQQEVSHHVEKQIEMVGIVEERKVK